MRGHRLYPVMEDYFKSWSYDMAYILGFISADGSVTKYTLSFELQKRDEAVLQFICKKISPNSIIKNIYKKKRWYCRLRINSFILCDSLRKYNVIQNKTHVIRADFEIPDEFFGAYLRGLFDGDGWAHVRRNIVESGICSSSSGFLNDLQNRIMIGKIRERQRKNSILWCWEFGYSESLKLRKLMYSDGGFCFARKYDKLFFQRQPLSIKFWTQYEIDFLLVNHQPGVRGNLYFLADHLKRSRSAISKKVWELNLASGN